MDSIKLFNPELEVDSANVEIDLDRLAEEIGEQGILNPDVSSRESDFFYLAGLALETQNDGYTITEALMEFIENCQEFSYLDEKDHERIESILEGDVYVSDNFSK